jgi:Zn-dependent protease with chaperone function
VENEKFIALTIGYIHPMIIVSTYLLDYFPEGQVHAILLHEQFHAEKRDPLKLLLISIVMGGLGYIPLLKGLVQYYRSWRELFADRYAVLKMGSGYELGHVLLQLGKLLKPKEPYSEVSTSFAKTDVNYRIIQLLKPKETVDIPFMRPKSWVTSLLVVAMKLIIFVSCVDTGFVLHKYLF